MIGYSRKLANSVENSSAPHKLGVRLGKYCVEHEISVAEIAERFKVSRPTIYNWFNGIYDPHEDQAEEIENFLKQPPSSD